MCVRPFLGLYLGFERAVLFQVSIAPRSQQLATSAVRLTLDLLDRRPS